jgi:signal transduction histidine kinase
VAVPSPFRLRDIAIAVVLLGAALFEIAVGAVPGPTAVSVPASAVATAALAGRVRTPRLTFAAVTLALAAQSLFDVPLSSIAVLGSMLIAAYSLARHVPMRPALTAAALGGGVQSVALWGLAGSSFSDIVFVGVLTCAPFTAGLAIRSRQLYADAMSERATLLDRSRDDQARAAVADERARMARELHDVIAHNLSVAVIQAVAARGELDDVPGAGAGLRHLADAEESCRRALTEMRQLLDVLRPVDTPAPVEPAPGLLAVGELVDRVRGAGLPVELTVEGERPDMPSGLDLSLFRVVQESLTNALRHSGGAATQLIICYLPGGIDVEVLDRGSEAVAVPGTSGAGRGLAGMRERVELFGGTLEAGPRPGGGFRVHVRVPLGPNRVESA